MSVERSAWPLGRLRLLVLVCLTLLAASCTGRAGVPAPSSCQETHADPATSGAIQQARPLVRRLAAGLRAPGIAVAVGAHGHLVWSLACGVADLDTRRPVTTDTVFRIGSVSKTLTAAALVRLAERHALDLDAPIQRYVPAFPPKPGRITLRRLAGHLGGIRHYQTPDEILNRRHFDSVTASVAIFADDPLVAPPGARFAYSSYGYDLLGAALEQVTHHRFAEAMQTTVFAPARMRHTAVDGAANAPAASFYEVTDDGGYRPTPPVDLSDRLPGGGLVATAEDLVRFGEALVDGNLVGRHGIALLFTEQRTRAGQPTGYGLGFEIHNSPHGPLAGHLGTVAGGTAVLLLHPRTRTVLALTANLGYVTAERPPPPAAGTPDPPAILGPFMSARPG